MENDVEIGIIEVHSDELEGQGDLVSRLISVRSTVAI